MRLCAVIIAGGQSSRMGREKALETVRGQTILDRAIACLSEQADCVAINANGDLARFAPVRLPVFPDIRTGVGSPLAGLHSALSYGGSHGFDSVLTVPSDVPFLPRDLVVRLSAAGGPAAITASDGQVHYLTGLWPVRLLNDLEDALPLRRMQDWAGLCGAEVIEWPVTPYDPFFNINTPDDLAEAERIAARFSL